MGVEVDAGQNFAGIVKSFILQTKDSILQAAALRARRQDQSRLLEISCMRKTGTRILNMRLPMICTCGTALDAP
jgi:hypothetical protein